MSSPQLPREAFLALASVAWADGTLDPPEVDAIARAAVEEGFDLGEIESIQKAIAQPVEIGNIDVSRLDASDRYYVYAMAVWVAAIDRGVGDKEHQVLSALQARLGLSALAAAAMEQAVCDLLVKPGGMRTSRFALDQLKRDIHFLVEQAKAAG